MFPPIEQICPPDSKALCEWIVSLWGYGPTLFIFVLAAFGLYKIVNVFGKSIEGYFQKQFDSLLHGLSDRSTFGKTKNAYLRKVIEDCQAFRLKGVEVNGVPVQLGLDQTFITLRLLSPTNGRLNDDETGRPRSFSELFTLSPRIAIIGAAGSGKSSLLQWAALACARALSKGEREKLLDEQKRFLVSLGKQPLIPILISLRAFNYFCEKQNRPRSTKSLLFFLSYTYQEKYPTLDISETFFVWMMKQGCLLMFDGIDEVNPIYRAEISRTIEQFVQEFFAAGANRYIVTSRTVAYVDESEVSEFAKFAIQSLSREQREGLVHKWFQAVSHLTRIPGHIEYLNRQLESPYIRDLAVTPLMVNIIAMVFWQKGVLPGRRGDLFEEAIKIILGEPYRESVQRTSYENTLYHLYLVAFKLHLMHESGDAIPENDLVQLIRDDFGDEGKESENRARNFIREIADQGGLLEEQNLSYGFFTHRSFKEFLAGCYFAERLSLADQKEFLELHIQDDQWEEPIRFGIAHLVLRSEKRALDLVDLLLGTGKTAEAKSKAITIAGMCFLDFPATKRIEAKKDEARDMLFEAFVLKPQKVSPVLRSKIGIALGVVGDPRFKRITIRNPREDETDPVKLIFPNLLKVPAGEFMMGLSEQNKRMLEEQNITYWEEEEPSHFVYLSDYWISKFPVTVAEFGCFIDDHGYQRREFWSDIGLEWLAETWISDLSGWPEDWQKRRRAWLEKRKGDRKHLPYWWEDPDWRLPSLPIIGISWFEAEAYCNWLSQVTGLPFCLPTEAQWEKAARGTAASMWTWGNSWDPGKCNTEISGIGKPSVPGCFPESASVYGVQDMIGNIWELCVDWYDKQEYQKRTKPVIDPHGPSLGYWKVSRGGAYYTYPQNPDRARCTARVRAVLDHYGQDVGFRVVCLLDPAEVIPLDE